MERVAPMPVTDDVRALAARVPDGVRLGTSSWAYAGWRGLVYAPLARLVPATFRFTVKAEQRCTRPDLAADGTTFGNATAHRAGAVNPHFLDAAFAWERVVAPALEGLGDRMGPVVFQFPHMDLAAPARLARAVVVRWMLLAATTYDEASAAFEPFDRLQAPDPATRAEIVDLLAACGPGRPGFVVCNNKAEGCAALSVRAIAEELAARGTG